MLDREELQKFLIQAQADGCYELFLLDLCTGLRRGELIALQWDDLNFETGVLTVNKQAYTVNGELQIIPPKPRRPCENWCCRLRCWPCCGNTAKGGFPLDVSVPGEGGPTDHTRRGAQAASDDTGAGRLQACQIP